MKIYTKTGDKGSTGLFNGQRILKSDLRVNTYGTVDELNSIIGLINAHKPNDLLFKDLTTISNLLFDLGTDLATPSDPPPKFDVNRINSGAIEWLENRIDFYTQELPKLKVFILPGGNLPASFMHLARTVCRRAERLAVELSETAEINDYVIKFLNRLSDYLFTISRYENFTSNIGDIAWEPQILNEGKK